MTEVEILLVENSSRNAEMTHTRAPQTQPG